MNLVNFILHTALLYNKPWCSSSHQVRLAYHSPSYGFSPKQARLCQPSTSLVLFSTPQGRKLWLTFSPLCSSLQQAGLQATEICTAHIEKVYIYIHTWKYIYICVCGQVLSSIMNLQKLHSPTYRRGPWSMEEESPLFPISRPTFAAFNSEKSVPKDPF